MLRTTLVALVSFFFLCLHGLFLHYFPHIEQLLSNHPIVFEFRLLLGYHVFFFGRLSSGHFIGFVWAS
jgi:hypothetical protein